MPESKITGDRQETIVYRTTIHWAALSGPVMLFVLGGISVRTRPIPALVMLGIAVIWGIFCIRSLRWSEFVLTESKFIARIGFPFKRFYEIPYSKIGGADFLKPALGIFMDFGKIMILQRDNKTVVFRLVAKPRDLIEKLKKEITRAHEAPNAENPA